MIVRKARKWDIEGVSPDPGDDMADTSVILMSVGKKDRERRGSGVLVSRDVSVSFGRKGSTAPTFVTTVTTSAAGNSREAVSSCSVREERVRNVNVNSSRSLSLGMRQPLNANQLKRVSIPYLTLPTIASNAEYEINNGDLNDIDCEEDDGVPAGVCNNMGMSDSNTDIPRDHRVESTAMDYDCG